MNINKFFFCIGLIIITACTPSAGVVQTAIAKTQIALPTGTSTSVPPQPTLLLKIPTALPSATRTVAPSSTAGLVRAGSPIIVEASVTPTPTQEKSNSISWDEAGDYIGKLITVCGPVVAAYFAKSSNGQPTFLNLGKDYPDTTRFVGLIWGSDRERFPAKPEQYYLGKTICITGIISVYQGLAEMEIKDPDQITIQ